MAATSSSSQHGHETTKTQLWKTRNQLAQKEGARSTVYLVSGEKYQGEWQDNKRHGKGIVTYKGGDKYEGDWACGVRHGQGTLWVYKDGHYVVKYSGEWDNDQPGGTGLYYDDSGNSYDGEWREGLRHGRGKAIYNGRPVDGFGGDVYEGNWENDMRHGPGTMMYANGDMYEGHWADNCKHGQGTFYYVNRGRRFDGVWHEDIPKCGSYSEIAPAPPGAPGSLPNLELANPTTVVQLATAAAVAAL